MGIILGYKGAKLNNIILSAKINCYILKSCFLIKKLIFLHCYLLSLVLLTVN